MNSAGELRADFDALSAIGRQAQGGWSRPAFGPVDCAANAWFMQRAREAGLSVRADTVGNVIARLEGRPGQPAIAVGSHLDTVMAGGAFDGAIGVLAGLEAVRNIHRSEKDWPVPLEVIAFRDEEGRFGAFTGSRAMMGLVSRDEVERRRAVDGTTLSDALRQAGLDPQAVPQARRDAREFAAFLELHIEQGSVLEQAGVAIGIVTAIAGQERMAIKFQGAPDHAGTTPMDMRRDAFAAAARFADRFRDMVISEGEGSARGTVGIVKVSPNQGNVVPSEVRLGLEIRDVSAQRLKRLQGAAAGLARAAAEAMKVDVSIRTVYQAEPVEMAQTVRDALSGAARALGVEAMALASGANHDAGVLGTLVPAGMVFVPSRGGRSHCPEEHTEWPHVEAGARVLERAVRDLAARMIESGESGK